MAVELDVHVASLRPGEGELLRRDETGEVFLLGTQADATVTWSRFEPGVPGPGPHVHREHTDAFFVLEGELVLGIGPGASEVVRAPAGTFVAVPPNVVHTFANADGAEARFLNLHSPDAGFAAFMRARRGGGDAAWDSFDPPADGGRPASEVVVVRTGFR